MDQILLQISSLSIKIGNRSILKDIQFKLKQGETISIAGESGSGKSMTALAIMGLLPKEVIILGSILWQWKVKQIDLIKSSIKERRNLRGHDMTMIFQEPISSLNPIFKCEEQIAEVLCTHQKLSRKEAKRETTILLEISPIFCSGMHIPCLSERTLRRSTTTSNDRNGFFPCCSPRVNHRRRSHKRFGHDCTKRDFMPVQGSSKRK